MSNISGIGLISLLENKEKLIGLEIGCYAGVNAENLLDNLPQLTLYGVDPYTSYIDWHGGLTCHEKDTAEQQAYEKLSPFKDRFIFTKKTSDDAVSDFEDDFFDFIFIDGLHTKDQVLKDCTNYYSKLKTSGIFSGHDYNAIVGVKEAVDIFAKQKQKIILQTNNDVWYWMK